MPPTTALNPFPAYPVVRLLEAATDVGASTVKTEAIRASRTFIDQYAEQWQAKRTDPNLRIEPLIVAVKGDYGTGKTHLLLDAIARLGKKLGTSSRAPVFVRVSCIGADPVTWFRAVIGPALMQPFVRDALVGLYAKAGQLVASAAKLTEAAVRKLEEDPASIYKLVKENLLNPTAIDQHFDALLEDLCGDTGEEVRRALAAVVWSETADAGVRWVAGSKLSDYDLEKLGISRNLSLDADAGGVLVALAAIHAHLDVPFGLMIDELEHLTQYDKAQGNRNNLTWLKRLLEALSHRGALTYVAGHWSAWEAQADYLDRFSQLKPIQLYKLTVGDVLNIVRARIPGLLPSVFGTSQAQLIIEVTDGTIRRVTSLCHHLFQKTDGFVKAVEPELVLATAVEIGQRISLDEAILRAHELLEQLGLRVQREASLEGGWQFDLVGYVGSDPRVVAEFKHAVTQTEQRGIARRFLKRMGEIQRRFPDVMGFFMFDGSIDEEQLTLLSSAKQSGILYLDLSERDVLSRLADELRARLAPAGGAGEKERLEALLARQESLLRKIDEARASERQELERRLREEREGLTHRIAELQQTLETRARQSSEIERQLDALEKRRADELEALKAHIAALSERIGSVREKAVITSAPVGEADQLNAIYTELTRPPGFWVKLRASGNAGVIALVSSVTAIVLLLIPGTLLPIGGYASYLLLKFALPVGLLVGAISGMLIQINRLDRYQEFSNRILRELYLRSARPQDLTKADLLLRDSLDRAGASWGKGKALGRLAAAFPGIFDELADVEVRR